MTAPAPLTPQALDGLEENYAVVEEMLELIALAAARPDLQRYARKGLNALPALIAAARAGEEMRAENEALTKALTGLTCGGSEFFTRKDDRYVADIDACVAWVRQTKTDAHRRTVDAMLENKRLRDALERIATVDQGGAFLNADACRNTARTALSKEQPQ